MIWRGSRQHVVDRRCRRYYQYYYRYWSGENQERQMDEMESKMRVISSRQLTMGLTRYVSKVNLVIALRGRRTKPVTACGRACRTPPEVFPNNSLALEMETLERTNYHCRSCGVCVPETGLFKFSAVMASSRPALVQYLGTKSLGNEVNPCVAYSVLQTLIVV